MLYKQRDDDLHLNQGDQEEFDELRTLISPSYFSLEMAQVLQHLQGEDNLTDE